MRQLYDFEKNIVFFRSAGTFEIVKLILLYDLSRKHRIWRSGCHLGQKTLIFLFVFQKSKLWLA